MEKNECLRQTSLERLVLPCENRKVCKLLLRDNCPTFGICLIIAKKQMEVLWILMWVNRIKIVQRNYHTAFHN